MSMTYCLMRRTAGNDCGDGDWEQITVFKDTLTEAEEMLVSFKNTYIESDLIIFARVD